VRGSDYAAAWEIIHTGADSRSAEEWARDTFEGAPLTVRAFIVAGWIGGLGLRLGPRPSPGHVLGWTIVTTAPDLIVLSVRSVLLGTAYLVLEVEAPRVVLSSFVRYEKRPARVLWSSVAPIHQRVVPYLLGHAAAHPMSA
jgi:hypothetical protein